VALDRRRGRRRPAGPRRVADLLAAADALDEPVHLVDVRPFERFVAGHVPGAVPVPSGELVQRTDDHLGVHGAAVVLVCDDGTRAAVAATWLRRMGRQRVVVVDGGWRAWDDEGLPSATDDGGRLTGAQVAASAPHLDAGEALAAAPGLLWSVAPSSDYARGHPAPAGWLSATWLERDLAAAAVAADAPVVFCGDDELAVGLAAVRARRAGWHRAAALRGGTRAWQDAGGEVVAGGPDDVVPDDAFVPPIDRGVDGMRAYLDWEVALTDRS
jgi:rhodanese-related sulfurtransferase